jgi:hypothetical protein
MYKSQIYLKQNYLERFWNCYFKYDYVVLLFLNPKTKETAEMPLIIFLN